jgi:mannitol/fructose-specific phosphotransferase system IIA component (Ntr-type)
MSTGMAMGMALPHGSTGIGTRIGISHLLKDDTFRQSLHAAQNAEAILKLVRNEERISIFDRFRRVSNNQEKP